MCRLCLIRILLNFVTKGPADNGSAMAQAMARSRTGDKPLPESMQTEFAVAYMWPQGQVSTRQNYSIWHEVTTYIVYFVIKGPTDNGSAVVSGNGLATSSWQAITWISAEKFTTIYMGLWGGGLHEAKVYAYGVGSLSAYIVTFTYMSTQNIYSTWEVIIQVYDQLDHNIFMVTY